MIYLVGLGNPGEEYRGTRHNIGRIFLEELASHKKLTDFEFDKKKNALVNRFELGKEKVVLILPETFMNRSGLSLVKFIKPKVGKNKELKNLVVVYDDLDLKIGDLKISYNKGSGGHKGLESIIKSLKTKEFIRVRIGVSPTTLAGKIKKPIGEKAVLDFILGKFKPSEQEILKKVFKQGYQIIDSILTEGYEKAMNRFN